MKTELLALLLTQLTVVIAQISTTTPLPAGSSGLGKQAVGSLKWAQRGTKYAQFLTSGSTINPQTSATLEARTAYRSIRSSASTEAMYSDKRVLDDNESCEDDVFDEVYVSEAVVSSQVLKDKANLINLSENLANAGNDDEKGRQLIVDALNKPSRIALIVFSVGMEDLMFYTKGDQVASSRNLIDKPRELGGGPFWTKPWKSCRIKSWVFGFSQPIRGFLTNRRRISVYYDIQYLNIKVDHCKPNRILGSGPKCDSHSTMCISENDAGFRPGSYVCICRPGFYSSPPNTSLNSSHFNGIGAEDVDKVRCLVCPTSCSAPCELPKECTAHESQQLRTVLLSFQLAFMSGTFILIIVVCKNRKCKTIASGMWTIIELILFGCIILYGTVLLRWFKPTTELCIIEPWCREVGFVVCYGAIILKLYRILIEFRTRKAHRWVVRDKDLLKYLLGMIIVVFGYMAAWTATNLDMITKENYSIVTLGHTHDGLSFLSCKSVWWDYVTQTGEILILVFGVHLSYASRNAISPFQERCFLCMVISLEAVVSAVFYVLRFIYWDSMSPDVALLAYFIRSHLTTTLVILLILVPKWFYQQELTRCKVSRHYLTQESGRAPFEAFKPQDGVTATSSDVEGELNLADMNPDDIRAELKRLYTQLEVLKNKTIRYENPHISKRRGGRKMAHRRFSLQKKGSREKNLKHHAAKNLSRHEVEAEPSRTPEDSVCSTEGPSIILNDGPSDILPSTPKRHAK